MVVLNVLHNLLSREKGMASLPALRTSRNGGVLGAIPEIGEPLQVLRGRATIPNFTSSDLEDTVVPLILLHGKRDVLAGGHYG